MLLFELVSKEFHYRKKKMSYSTPGYECRIKIFFTFYPPAVVPTIKNTF